MQTTPVSGPPPSAPVDQKDVATPDPADQTAHYVLAAVVAVVGGVLMAGGVRAGLSSTPGPLGPGAFPLILGALLLGLAAVLAFAVFRRTAETQTLRPQNFGHTRRTLLLDGGLLVAYCVALPYLGYVITTLAYMLVALTVVRSGRVVPRLVIAVMFVVGTYFLFDRMLQVRLPVSVIPGIVI